MVWAPPEKPAVIFSGDTQNGSQRCLSAISFLCSGVALALLWKVEMTWALLFFPCLITLVHCVQALSG